MSEHTGFADHLVMIRGAFAEPSERVYEGRMKLSIRDAKTRGARQAVPRSGFNLKRPYHERGNAAWDQSWDSDRLNALTLLELAMEKINPAHSVELQGAYKKPNATALFMKTPEFRAFAKTCQGVMLLLSSDLKVLCNSVISQDDKTGLFEGLAKTVLTQPAVYVSRGEWLLFEDSRDMMKLKLMGYS